MEPFDTARVPRTGNKKQSDEGATLFVVRVHGVVGRLEPTFRKSDATRPMTLAAGSTLICLLGWIRFCHTQL